MFVIHIMRYKWDKAAPYPGFKGIAKRMGLSAEGARLLARNLEKKGYLYRQMRVGQTNRFHFDNLFASLEKLMASDKMAVAHEDLRPGNVMTTDSLPDMVATVNVDGKEVVVTGQMKNGKLHFQPASLEAALRNVRLEQVGAIEEVKK